MSNSKGRMRVYCCGGAGVNQGKVLLTQPDAEGFASLDVAMVDTSRSNMLSGVPDEVVYILPNVDGSGKKRSENHQEIANTVKDVLVKQKPTDFNVVIFSTAGGSGSVYGPLIMRELMMAGLPVVGIVIGNLTTAIEAKNTVNTLKSLDNIARKVNVPAVIQYSANSKSNSRKKVDEFVQQSVLSLALLVSRQNEELDTSDVSNWVRYNNVTEVPAQLALLNIVVDEEDARDIVDPISVASVVDAGNEAVVNLSPDYGCVGYKAATTSTDTPELHYVISISAVQDMFATINSVAVEYDEVKASRPNQQALITKDDNTTDHDLIL